MKRVDHRARRRRRFAIAQAAEGKTSAQAAAELGVSQNRVLEAVHEFGVALAPAVNHSRMLQIMADAQNHPELALAEIARRHDVTRAYVSQVVRRGRDAGFKFPGRR